MMTLRGSLPDALQHHGPLSVAVSSSARVRTLVPLALFLALTWCPEPVDGQETGVDYAFLVDVSRSMSGAAGHANVFPRVQAAITGFVTALDPGTTLFFFPFAESVREIRSFLIDGPPDIATVNAYVNGLVANGDQTAVFNSIESALETVNTYREVRGGQRAVMFYVYTDGDDNVSAWTLAEILRHFSLSRGDNDWLYYTELGLPRNPEKEDLFEENENTVLVTEPEGEVQPIRQVEALLPFLHFGNLRETGSSSRTERFIVRSEHGLPDDFEITVEADFPELAAQGALADVRPASFRPEGDVILTLQLINPSEVQDGSYSGTVEFVSADRRAFVTPSSIAVTFIMEPRRSVTVSPLPNLSFPVGLGEFQEGLSDSTILVAAMVLDFNPAARAAGEYLEFLLEAAPENPTELSLGDHVFIEGSLGPEGRVGANEERLTVGLAPTSDLSPGEYSGQIVLSSPTLVIEGDGLEAAGDPTAVSIQWAFTVTDAPSPWWLWPLILTVLFVLLVGAVRYHTRPPTFEDLRLLVLEPHREELDLAGETQVILGRDGAYLIDAQIRILIRADKSDGRGTAMLEPHEGEVSIERLGQVPMAALAQEELFDGDVIRFDGYRVRVSSFSLTRE